MYEAWQHRGIHGVTRWKWNRAACTMELSTKRDDLKRTRPRKGRHELDIAWRKQNPELDQWLARAEVAGWVLRRWAVSADVQHLELPITPGSLATGMVVEWTATEIRDKADELVTEWPREEAAA